MSDHASLGDSPRKTEPDWHCERCGRGIWNGRTKWVTTDFGLHHKTWFICVPCNVERERALEPLREWERAAWA